MHLPIVLFLALQGALGQADHNYLSMEQSFSRAVEVANKPGIMCLQPKLTLARQLITRYNTRELTRQEEQVIEQDLRELLESSERCPVVKEAARDTRGR